MTIDKKENHYKQTKAKKDDIIVFVKRIVQGEQRSHAEATILSLESRLTHLMARRPSESDSI
jgi:hypothetical protein